MLLDDPLDCLIAQVGDDGIVRLSHTFGNGDVYAGGWEGGGPHGEGTMTFAAGGRYDGRWSRGLPHGLGTLIFREGDRYLGSWHHGVPAGTGRLEYADGGVYDGGWAAPGGGGADGADAAAGAGGGDEPAARAGARSLPHHDVEPLARQASVHGEGLEHAPHACLHVCIPHVYGTCTA